MRSEKHRDARPYAVTLCERADTEEIGVRVLVEVWAYSAEDALVQVGYVYTPPFGKHATVMGIEPGPHRVSGA